MTLLYNELHTFTVANFTSETTPPYVDPEADALSSVKILSLPVIGSLELSAVPVIVNDVITESDISLGNLTYQCDPAQTVGYFDKSMSFTLSDAGSGLFVPALINQYKVVFLVGDDVNDPPSVVGDGNQDVALGGTLVFTRAMFTTGLDPAYADPESDAALNLRILRLPTNGDLKLSGSIVQLNAVIPFADIDASNFTYVNTSDDTDVNPENFEFEVSDVGSSQYTG